MVNGSLPRREGVNERMVNFGAPDLFLVQFDIIRLNHAFIRRRTRPRAAVDRLSNALKVIMFFSLLGPVK